MKPVRAKKHLGQHFLKDKNIAAKIVESLSGHQDYREVLEVGPGMGVLTEFLVQKKDTGLYLIEIDRESIEYLNEHFPQLEGHIIQGDFLKINPDQYFKNAFAVIGNFPYNISSQIFFKVIDHRNQIPEVVGMIQKEVAERLAAKHGNKTYGILSVLLQTYYDIEYLFTVHEHVFQPPPKVKSGVIRLRRNKRDKLPCDEVLFKTVVKQGFQNRRKTLRNALKRLNLPQQLNQESVLDKRAEQLSVEDFIQLTLLIQEAGN
ncbi:MAG: 16S rRNA (adenine(1518)-N(6)/adenine(1519)-N(6))-dimethyltransferase RsmA [Cytophagaceae bacterium]|nr:16S rRNA (adenine(1518)-N(6)/adenine(1519)-N(6))-dimethyltransferase RsmA [Cytophagaceae bacterium]